MKPTERVRLQLKLEAPATDIEGLLFRFLKQSRSRNAKWLALEAIQAYWVPLALFQAGPVTPEFRAVAQKCVAMLQGQADLISAQWGLTTAQSLPIYPPQQPATQPRPEEPTVATTSWSSDLLFDAS